MVAPSAGRRQAQPRGCPIISRIVHDALTKGLSAFAADEGLYDQLFADVWLLSATEVDQIKRYFRENPVEVVHGFPLRHHTKAPTIYIFLQSEEQPQHAVGDAGGAAGAGAGSAGIGAGSNVVGADSSLLTSSMWTHNYVLACVAYGTIQNCLYLYELAKAIMLAAKEYLQAGPRSLDLMSYGGSDAAPDSEHGPDILYIRNLQFRCMREYSLVDRGSSLDRYFKVDGVALPSDSAGAPTEVLALAGTFTGGRRIDA